MSTRSLINVKCEDGIVRSIYCHHDGYGHLPTLKKFYGSLKKAEKLIAGGDLSILDAKCTKPDEHSFDTPVDGYCVYYYRDRDEDWEDTKPKEFKTLKAARKQDRGQEFIYEFENDVWSGWNISKKEYI